MATTTSISVRVDEMISTLMDVWRLHIPSLDGHVSPSGERRADLICVTCVIDDTGEPEYWPCPTARAVVDGLGLEIRFDGDEETQATRWG